MQTILLTIHLVVCLGLIGLVLVQRSEGGALGVGGGGGGAFISGRGAANLIVRLTTIAGIIFFGTSITLSLIGGSAQEDRNRSVTDAPISSTVTPAPQEPVRAAPAAPTGTAQPTAATPGAVTIAPSPAAAAERAGPASPTQSIAARAAETTSAPRPAATPTTATTRPTSAPAPRPAPPRPTPAPATTTPASEPPAAAAEPTPAPTPPVSEAPRQRAGPDQ